MELQGTVKKILIYNLFAKWISEKGNGSSQTQRAVSSTYQYRVFI